MFKDHGVVAGMEHLILIDFSSSTTCLYDSPLPTSAEISDKCTLGRLPCFNALLCHLNDSGIFVLDIDKNDASSLRVDDELPRK
jgi:hypothetical protein